MSKNYLISIGGTGSRCLEAVIYMAAAGIFQNPMHILIIDPDQNNGNSKRTSQLIGDYHALHLAKQPKQAQLKGIIKLGFSKLPGPTIFQSAVNRVSNESPAQHAVFWKNPNPTQRSFKEVIQYTSQPDNLRDFLSLLYEPGDLEMVLDVGYRGRTNVGSVALKQDLEGTAGIADSGLKEFLENLATDLNSGEARVFVIGSVFGGTGAAGLPTIPALISSLPDEQLSEANRQKLRFGCAMMTPYFSFPQGNGNNNGPGTDSARHAVATQAALLHYAHVPPGYQHVYFIGAPVKPKTNDNNVVGGQNQTNAPHYAEIAAALAAWDFFNLGVIRDEDKQLHFADTLHQKQDLGIRWDTLPVHPDNAVRREEVKQRMIAFTTFAYFYKNFLYESFINHRAYKDTRWYRYNFGQLNLDSHGPVLRQLFNFSNMYLQWLHQIGDTGKQANPIPSLFNWDALMIDDKDLCARFVGNLVGGQTGSPRFLNGGYDRILSRFDGIRLRQPETDSAMGLFMYLLHYAVSEFCAENYCWKAMSAG